MGSFSPLRFSKMETLRKIDRRLLVKFFEPYAEYLARRGIALPLAESGGELDYAGLRRVLLTPDGSTPKEMSDALHFIDEMSTPDGFDLIQSAIEGTSLDGLIGKDAAPADLAIQVWMRDRNLLERLHGEQFIQRCRAFRYFKAMRRPLPKFTSPSEEMLRCLEGDLDDWFERKRRGRLSKVFMYPKPDLIWFLVRHGAPYTREGAIKDGESVSVYYRPERYDVIAYDLASGELRVKACSKAEKELYRSRFGLFLFGDCDFFCDGGKFSFAPLREIGEDSLACGDIRGMDWVKLKSLRIISGGAHRAAITWSSEDIFASLREIGEGFPARGKIARAGFSIKFSDSKTPRTVTLFSDSRAIFKRDGDAGMIEKWMERRSFIESEKDGANGRWDIVAAPGGSAGADGDVVGMAGEPEGMEETSCLSEEASPA